MFLIGFGGGVLNGATNALAADVSEGERGAKLSLLGVFFGIGALGMPSTLAALSKHFSLAGIVAGIGCFVLVPVVYFLVIAFPPPKQKAQPASATSGLALLKHPIFLLAGLALAIQSGMEGMSNDWMTRYFKKVTLSGQHAAEWKTLLGLMAVTGAMVARAPCPQRPAQAHQVPDRALRQHRDHRRRRVAADVMRTSYGVSLAAALLIGAGLAAAFPVVLSYIGDLYPAQSGTAFSTIFFIALIGNMTINKSFGLLAQIHGIEQYTISSLPRLPAAPVRLKDAAVLAALRCRFLRPRAPGKAPRCRRPDARAHSIHSNPLIHNPLLHHSILHL